MSYSTEFIAHRCLDSGREQSLREHLQSVAQISKDNAHGLYKEMAYLAGLLHDLGKYSSEFQRRIRGDSLQVEHALAGALESGKDIGIPRVAALLLQYVIIGHHSGLPDGGTVADSEDYPTLKARLKRKAADYSAFKKELFGDKVISGDFEKSIIEIYKARPIEAIEYFAFFTRYIYSCLTDADYLDTERFFSPQVRRGFDADFSEALKLLEQKLDGFIADTKVKKARARLLLQVKQNIEKPAQINFLNMPTGSGKTLTSLWAALHLAKEERKRRIIYVIPYTSIIEQTALEFKEIFGDSLTVLEHHSNYDFDGDNEKNAGYSVALKLKMAAENWDCPLIITTNVQFFESLYHYRSSRLRKLHNLADSIMVFDEIHTLPANYLQPCIRAVGHITKYLNSKAIFLSATMPKFDSLFEKYTPDSTIKNLISDISDYNYFRNCSIKNIGKISPEALALAASAYSSALIVTGTRKAAQALYKLLPGKKYHLSTYMTPLHRTEVIKNIKKSLKAGEKIVVVSTSLIEAGVDLDFETVYRELAGLDNILQSAGRCNREGRRATGEVFVYQSEDKLSGDVQIRAKIALNLLETYEDVSEEQCITAYFNRVYGFYSHSIDRNSIAGDSQRPIPFDALPFRSYAESFKFIDNATVAVVINRSEECEKLLQSLEYGSYRAKRSLQKYTVSVRKYELDNMIALGLVHRINDIYVLTNNKHYSDEYGLSIEESHDADYIF